MRWNDIISPIAATVACHPFLGWKAPTTHTWTPREGKNLRLPKLRKNEIMGGYSGGGIGCTHNDDGEEVEYLVELITLDYSINSL